MLGPKCTWKGFKSEAEAQWRQGLSSRNRTWAVQVTKSSRDPWKTGNWWHQISVTHYCCLVTESRLTLLSPCGLQPARLLCPWDSPGKNTAVNCYFLLQGIFLTQGPSWPRDWTHVSSIGRWVLYPWATEEPICYLRNKWSIYDYWESLPLWTTFEIWGVLDTSSTFSPTSQPDVVVATGLASTGADDTFEEFCSIGEAEKRGGSWTGPGG